jgi:hypothetical protein
LIKKDIHFTGDDNYYKVVKDVTTCINKTKNECDKYPSLCFYTYDNRCQLIIPKKNLVTNKYNDVIYVERITDQLIRYKRINSFIFDKNVYLSFEKISYNLKDNEILVIQSALTQEYFENLIEYKVNKYVKNTTYDQTNAQKDFEINTVKNRKLFSVIEDEEKEENKIDAENVELKGVFKKCLSSKLKFIKYDTSIISTYKIISKIIEKHNRSNVKITEIKQGLYEEYEKYYKEYTEQIHDILIEEGKIELINGVKSSKVTFNSLILSESYYLTEFDYRLLSVRYDIPVIILSNKKIVETGNSVLICNGNKEDNFAYICVIRNKNNVIPEYYIVNDKDEIFLPNDITSKKKCDKDFTIDFEEKNEIQYFLSKYTKNIKNKNKKKLLIQEDSDDENFIEEVA